MRKFLKILAGFVAFLVVVVMALVFLAKSLITVERVKSLVLPKVEQALHRKVTLGDVQVGLFSGIELHDLVVADLDGSEPLLRIDLVKLRYQLLPLLSRKVVIDEVLVQKPRLLLVRKEDGTLNIADLLAAAAKPADKKAPAEPSSAAGDGSAIDLLVALANVDDGRLLLVDRLVSQTSPARVELTGLTTRLTAFSLQGDLPVSLRGALNGAPFSLDGTVRPADKSGRLQVEIQGLDLTSFAPYYRAKIPGELRAAKFDLKTSFDGNAEVFSLRGPIALRDLSLRLDAFPKAPFERMTVQADVDLAADLGKGVLTVAKGDVDFSGIRLAATGQLRNLKAAPEADFKVQLPGLDLRQALAVLPSGLQGQAAAYEPAGTLRGSLVLKGRLADGKKMLRSAEFTLDQVQGSIAGVRPSVDGSLRLSGDQLAADALTLRVGSDTARIKLLVRSLYSKPFVITADLEAPRFPVELLAGGVSRVPASAAVTTGGGEKSPSSVASGTLVPARETGPFDLPVQASGTIRIGEGGWKGLTIRNFLTDYELRDNRLTIRRMTGDFAGGSFSNTARVDLNQPGLAYETVVNLKGVEMQNLLPALNPATANTLYGRLDMNGQVAGRGTRWDNISRTLSGDVTLSLADGKLVSPALVKGFADFLQITDLDEIVFRDFRGKAKLVNGRAEIDSSLVSSRIKLAPHGTVGLDGSLNVAMDTRLSPELTARLDQRGKVTRYLTDAEGWTQIPLLLTGTVKSPRYGLDPKGVQAQAGKVIEKELQRGLDKLLNRPKPQEQPSGDGEAGSGEAPAPQPASPAQQLLDESLKRLFKKQ